MRHDPGSQTCPRSTGPLGPCNLSATVTCTCVHTHTLSLTCASLLIAACSGSLGHDFRMRIYYRLGFWGGFWRGGSIYIYIYI